MIQNYIPFKTHSLLFYHFAYVDTDRCLALPILKKNRVRMLFTEVGVRDDCRYEIVCCKVRKKDLPAFTKAMAELAEEMPRYGYTDYGSFCEEIITKTTKISA